MSLTTLKVNEIASEFTQTGRYFRLIESVSPINVTFYFANGDTFRTALRGGIGVEFPPNIFDSPFTKYEITSDSDQTIEIFASMARVDDNRTEGLRVSQQGASDLVNTAQALTTAPVKIADTNINRRRVTIQTDAQIYVGGENVSASTGLMIDAGGTGEFEVKGELYALAATTANVRVMEEIN